MKLRRQIKMKWRSFVCVFLAILFGLPVVPASIVFADVPGDARLEQYTEMLADFGGREHFADFLADHADTVRPEAEYIIDAADYILVGGMEPRYYENFAGLPGVSVWTDEQGLVEWEVHIAQGGIFHMSVAYFPVEGRSSDIQRAVFVNGRQPFIEASPVEFHRMWDNMLDYIRQDRQGNDIRPSQVEAPEWAEVLVRDSMGVHNEPLSFELETGRNTIGFVSLREPMLIRHIRLHQAPEVLPYDMVSAERGELPRPSVSRVEPIRIEGESAASKSSPMLAPRANTGGPGVYPYSARHIRINYIGGNSWSQPGSWVEWEFTVPEDGLYKIAMNTLQNFHRGANSFRRVTINGEVPFAEMEAVPFGFRNGWRVNTLGGADDPYLFWLEAGTNTIRMEAILGDYAPFVREVQESLQILNTLYRQIVMLTGVTPDRFRDYHIGLRMPELREALMAERERLDRIFAGLDAMNVGRGDRNAMIDNLTRLLTLMYNDIENIPIRLANFRIHLGSLGTWVMLVREQMLAIDAIYILPYDAPTPDNGRRWWRQIWHEILTLIFSFIIDFNIIGGAAGDELRNVTVWLGTGRDQAHVIRRIIDETFTPNTGIGVNLVLIDMATLLPATVAGIGPDVTLSVFNSLPMDFGMRGAAADLAQFPDFEEVAARFPAAAMTPYRFRDYVFALPETVTFPMMFYRRDILHEIGLEPPDTWDDVRDAIATLSMHHMDFGMPVAATGVGVLDFPHFTYLMFLYQAGGDLYTPDGDRSLLDTELALNAFRDFTRFYTDYRLERVMDFPNRFRLGETPIGVVDYTTYNMLQVFAPEIRGLWGFRPVPGTIRPDGTIDRTVPTGGLATIMMEQAEDKEAAWEFMKWWTSADTQIRFGREMESIMGAAARHPTANLEAFSRMPWPVQDYRALQAQFPYARGIPEVPGGYFMARQIRNAFFTVVEEGDVGPREVLVDFNRLINDEIRAKRREFGID